MANLTDGTNLTGTITVSKATGTKVTLDTDHKYLTKDIELTVNVQTGNATGPSSLSGSSATITTGTNTITLTKTGVNTTPTVSAGYVSAATSSTATVALTASVTTKGAATITPTNTNQTIASGTYLTGTQTISGDANLKDSNIRLNTSIFGVVGSLDSKDHIVQGTFTSNSSSNSVTTVNVPYTGNGYPIAFIIYLDGGSTIDSSTNRYAITSAYGVKKIMANAMTYDGTSNNDGFTVQCCYKGSNSTSYSTGGSASATIGNQNNPNASTSTFISIQSKTVVKFYSKSSSYGLYPGKTYHYTIIYSS